jgi:hypothetical protein
MPIDKNVQLGKEVRSSDLVNLYGCIIATRLASGICRIQGRCKSVRVAKSHLTRLFGMSIEDEVSLDTMFINDRFPARLRRTAAKDRLLGREPTRFVGGAIGSNATILCGVTIGEGAGSVRCCRDRRRRPKSDVAGVPARDMTERERMTQTMFYNHQGIAQ